jgi:hypothetical protein
MNIIQLYPLLTEHLCKVDNLSRMAWRGTFFKDTAPIARECVGKYTDTNFVHLYGISGISGMSGMSGMVYVVIKVYVGSCDGCISSMACRINRKATEALASDQDDNDYGEIVLEHALSKASVFASISEAQKEFANVVDFIERNE